MVEIVVKTYTVLFNIRNVFSNSFSLIGLFVPSNYVQMVNQMRIQTFLILKFLMSHRVLQSLRVP